MPLKVDVVQVHNVLDHRQARVHHLLFNTVLLRVQNKLQGELSVPLVSVQEAQVVILSDIA